jgi:hypothetical protein
MVCKILVLFNVREWYSFHLFHIVGRDRLLLAIEMDGKDT